MSLKNLSFFILFVAILAGAVMYVSFLEYSGFEKSYQIEEENLSEETVAQYKITEEEKDFNESGRAKAVEDEEDLWKYYESEHGGILFSYPHNVILSDSSDSKMDYEGDQYYLTVDISDIETLTRIPMSYDKEDALINQKALASGIYGEPEPFSAPGKIRSLSGINAQDYMVFARFDICDVVFERKLYFFNNDKLIVITLHGPIEIFSSLLGDYMKIDEKNCGDHLMWDVDSNKSLSDDLLKGIAPEKVQGWYDTFDQIANTIEFLDEENVELSNLELIKGRWVSVDDDNSIVKFTEGMRVDYYAEEKISESVFGIYDSKDLDNMMEDKYGDYLAVGEDDKVIYSIDKLDEESLILTYLDRGNTLKYKRLEE